MTATVDIAGYCRQCGAAFPSTAGPFCRHCGNRVRWPPEASPGWSYPTVPASSVPTARHKLGNLRFVAIAGLALAVLVAGGTVATLYLRPPAQYCHFSCGPDLGPRLLSAVAYQSSQFGYRVEYDAGYFRIHSQSPSGVELDGNPGFLAFSATTGADVTGALQGSIASLSTNLYQDLHETSAEVHGAAIGGVPGAGEVYAANYVAPGSGRSFPVTIVVMASTQADLTIGVLAVGFQELNNYALLPFGLVDAQAFDFEASNTIWPDRT